MDVERRSLGGRFRRNPSLSNFELTRLNGNSVERFLRTPKGRVGVPSVNPLALLLQQ